MRLLIKYFSDYNVIFIIGSAAYARVRQLEMAKDTHREVLPSTAKNNGTSEYKDEK